MTRTNTLPTTGELNKIDALVNATVEACRNSCRATIAAEAITRSGHLAYFSYAEYAYSISTLLCACAGITIELAADGTPREYINATYTCAQHGTHQSTAIRCAETTQHTKNQAFAWVEKRHARDRRVQWGMSRRAE